MSTISAQELVDKLSSTYVPHILDVREDIEFHSFNIGGTHIPLGILPAQMDDLDWEKTDEVVVVCRAGVRSETACRILKQAGFTQVRNLAGGLSAVNRILQKP